MFAKVHLGLQFEKMWDLKEVFPDHTIKEKYFFKKIFSAICIDITQSTRIRIFFEILHFFFSGKPILGAVKDEYMVFMATAVYVAIFFSPKDIVYEAIKLVPIYATICFLKEILRAKKVYKGLAEGKDAMPSGGSLLFIPVIIATLKGDTFLL